MNDLVESGLLSVGAFAVLIGVATVVVGALELSLSAGEVQGVWIVLAIAALFVGFNA